MTPPASETSLFAFDTPGEFDRFRGILEKTGYTDSGVLEALGVKDFPSIRGSDTPLLVRRTNRGTPLDTIIRLFLIEVPCGLKDVQSAVQPIPVETLARAGLVEISGSSVTAAVKFLPFRNLLVDSTRRGGSRRPTGMTMSWASARAASLWPISRFGVMPGRPSTWARDAAPRPCWQLPIATRFWPWTGTLAPCSSPPSTPGSTGSPTSSAARGISSSLCEGRPDLRMVQFVDRVVQMQDGKLVRIYEDRDEIMELAAGTVKH